MAEARVFKHHYGLAIWILLSVASGQIYNFKPRFTNVPAGTRVDVREDLKVGDTIFTPCASDADGDTLVFTVTTTDVPLIFDETTAKRTFLVFPIVEVCTNLTVSRKQPGFDYESRKEYDVTIQVTDRKGKASVSVAYLTIRVLNTNDNPPVLTVYQGTVTINEETPIGTQLPYLMTFSDVDYPDSPYVGLMGDDARFMNIDSSTGRITLNSVIDVDPNTPLKMFKPILYASDGSLTTTTTITLIVNDINDNAPVCIPSTFYAEITEEQTGNRVVTSLNCTDRDSLLNNNNKLNYTIIQGNSALFSVSNSGAFSVLTSIDYEKTKAETVIVRVEDGGNSGHLHTTATVSVLVKPVNDIWPIWGAWSPEVPADLTYFVNENAPQGTSILTVFASDADLDVGNDITYSMIVTTAGGSPKTNVFNIDPNTGLVSTRSQLERDGPDGISQYTVILQASDGPLNSHTINRTVNLVVKDFNDNAPKFVGVPYSVIVMQEENARAGTVVTQVSATDDDSISNNLAFSVGAVLSGNTPLSTWRFSTVQQGQLELATVINLDVDNPPASVSVLRLLVRDNGVPELTGTATLTVSIVPDNEFSPTIIMEPGAVPVKVREDTLALTQITRIEGRDRDKGPEGVLNYSITAGNTGQAFSIDSNGWISTQVTLNRETRDQYILTVLISDSGVSIVRSVTTTVTIEVTDVNDNSPTCQSEFQSVTVPETSPVNSIIANISCSDADSDVLTSLVRPPLDSIFVCRIQTNSVKNTWTWELKLLRELDYDSGNQSYRVEIEVSDGKSILPVQVLVSLTPVNEARPVFQTNPTVTVPENVMKNPLIVYQATDSDYSPHDIVSYKISSVSRGGDTLFNIDSKSASLHLLAPIDYEALPVGDKTYTVVVVAEDGGGLKGTGTVTVVVTDVNDNSPVCNQSLYFVQVSEKQNGTGPYNVLSDLDCRDLESGKNLTYLLNQTPGDHFTIRNSGIQLKTDSLDYETSTSHVLTVRVMDSGNPPLTSTVTVYVAVINEDDGGPYFPAAVPVNISETVDIGQFVADVKATDPDGTDSDFGDLQYSIIAGDTNNQFFIDAQTGRVSTRKKLDFETVSTYRLVVQAKEKKGIYSTSVTQIINVIDVNDEKPVCSMTSFLQTVLESEPVSYTVINLICEDADAGTILTYTIVSGNTTVFKMEGNQIKLKAKLDYEELPITRDLIILVSDGVASYDLNITGTVITGSVDEGPPKFDRDTYTVRVLENQTVYTNITTLKATDPDSSRDQNGQVKYSLTAPNQYFTIDTFSGKIILADSLDREREATHVLIVKAEDALGSATATVSVVVDDVNDNPPRFKSSVYRGQISKKSSVGTSVLTVQATDADDPNVNNYGTVQYQMSGSSDFRIDTTSGLISSTTLLDADNKPRFYSLTVTATDSKGATNALSSTCIVNIYVTTANQHAPVFTSSSYTVTIQENQFSVDDVIQSVSAKDEDAGADGEFTMTLVSTDSKFYLTQTGSTGAIHLQEDLDFENGDTAFLFEITATDKGSPARTGTCTVTVIVDDTNDNTPLCPRNINLDKVEGETNLTRIVCSDADPNSILSYTVISTTPNNIQPAVSKDGVLTTTTPLDYERSPTYQILLQVRDNGSPALTTSITIRLHLIDVNDNDPTFSGPLTFFLPENTSASNTVLFTVPAKSNDGPTDKLTYNLSDNAYFQITSDTGDIKLIAAAPDYETVGSLYTMEVCINDSPNPTVRTACGNITVFIQDSNDELPRFSPPVYQTTVAESAEVGKSLVTVTATDRDASPIFNTLSFSIKEGNAEGCFRIRPNGVIELSNKVDFERTQYYSLLIQATDGVYNTTAYCYITVTPVNEHAPTFPASEVTVHVEENVPAKTFIYTAVATDSDREADGTVRYSIDPGPFVIDSQSGNVSVIESLDREITPFYNLTVRAVDRGSIPKTGTLLLTIIVDDVNDHTPSCGTNSHVVSVPESISPGDTVVALNCVDDDDDPSGLNNALTYAISSTQTDVFTIDQSGHLKLKPGAVLDRETQAFYLITVTVTDQGPKLRLTSTVDISLTVLDVNDNSPYFTSILPVNVSEDTPPGTTIQRVKAEDRDEGINKQLTYQIASGNSDNIFSLGSSSGDLVLSKSLSFQTKQQHVLLITVRDRGSPARSTTGTMTVTVTDHNDNRPVCATAMYTAIVKENSINENVVTVSCDDVDVTGVIKYNISSGNDGNFMIDAKTGTVKTKADAQLDFETVKSYLLEVTASDGLYSDTSYVRITVTDVNEFPPRFTPPGPVNVTVPENAEINLLVYEFKATDQDTGDLVKVFSIVNGNSAQKFLLDSMTGKLQLWNTLDYENVTSYILSVMVEDSGSLNDTMKFYINVADVNDNSPTCHDKYVTLTIPEGLRNNSVYLPSCFDADKVASPILDYSLPVGTHREFAINNSTGQLSLVQPLDYEQDIVIWLTILVKEKGIVSPRETSINIKIIVDPVNEFDPVFKPTNVYGPYYIQEDTAPGTVVAQVTATDADKGPNDGAVRYTITSGDLQGLFWIDEMNGDIHVFKQLSRDKLTEGYLTVTATDGIPGSDTAKNSNATVKLFITDVNDHRPQLIPSLLSLNVTETSQYGPSIVLAYLIVEDKDEGINSATTITILSGNSEKKFTISGHNLILSGQLDYETTPFYELLLEVTDAGQPPLKSSGRVRIKVLPVNEATPYMEKTSANITIPENSPLGTLIYEATATDSDNEVHGQITYSIEGNSSNEFVINPITGQLFVNAPLDYDVPPNVYTVVIRATDGAGASDPVTSAVSLRVTLSDVNDNAPRFSASVVNMNVSENVLVGTKVGVIIATDPDSGNNGDVKYSQISGTGNKYFTVDPTTGIVATVDAIDYEKFQIFYISVLAYDGGTPSLTSNCLIKVEIRNVNDNYPVISPQDILVEVSETTPAGETILTYSASDMDTAISAFSLVNESQYFEVDPASGTVRTKSMLYKEKIKIHKLYIQVRDMATPTDPTIHTSTATLTISVNSINHNPVISGVYNKSVPENISINEIIFKINATDEDSGQNGNLTYLITEGNSGSPFSIDLQGNVQVTKPLDRETVSSYTLTIQVTDHGIPPGLAEVQAFITVTDINDNDPVFSRRNYTFTVPEDASVGFSVGNVTASDADSGINSDITYMFDYFTVGDMSHFSLHRSRGTITVATPSLDRQLMPSYVAQIKVMDAGSPKRSSFAQVIITVRGNEHSPVFPQATYSAILNEESIAGTHILQVTAVDSDVGMNAELSYFIDTKLLDGPTAKTYLQINRTSGDITTISKVNYEEHHVFTIIVVAVDKGSPALTGTTSVIITVSDINDNSPIFWPSFYNTEVAYNGDCNNVITTVSATDEDSGKNAEIAYFLLTDTYQYLFEVAGSSGEVKLKSVATPATCYRLLIQAVDSGEPARKSAVPARMRVDTFVPSNVVISFRFGISRSAFLAEVDKFISSMERVIHTKYPLAVVRLWCIVEYEGVATVPANQRRRLLADMPVDVHVYALRDNTSNSEENLYKDKDFVLQDELIDLFSDPPQTDPNNTTPGAQWDYQNVTIVRPYREKTAGWFDEPYGKIITAIIILLGLFLLGLLLFFALRFCCGCCGGPISRKRKVTAVNQWEFRKVKPEIVKIKQKQDSEMLELNRLSQYSSYSRSRKVSLQDMDPLVMMTLSSKEQYPGFVQSGIHDNSRVLTPDKLQDQSFESKNSEDSTNPRKKRSSSTSDSGFSTSLSSPRAMVISMNKEGRFTNYPTFDRVAYDPLSSRLYWYDSVTNARQWVK